MSKGAISFLIVLLLVASGLYSCANLICQHRADYKGGVTFAGESQRVFGSVYTRVAMWRDAADTTPLPDITVHLGEEKFRLDEFTPEVVQKLGSSPTTGTFADSENNLFQYRFTDGRLTWFCLDRLRRSSTSATSGNTSSVALSFGDGKPFVMPMKHKDLVRHAGKPERTYLHFAQ